MYISPKIYHINNLTPKERDEIRRADFLIRNTLAYRREAILMDMDDPTITTMGKMQCEEHLAALDDVWEEYKMARTDEITAMLEAKPEVYDKYIREYEPEVLGDYWDASGLYD